MTESIITDQNCCVAARTSLRVNRLAEIERILSEGVGVTVDDLTERFGVSQATVRRDLDSLQASGVVQRTHGGAVSSAVRLREQPLRERSGANVAEKQAIAGAAVALVAPGETVFVGGGTTTLRLAQRLADVPLTVVTNSLPVADQLAQAPSIKVIVIGGTLRTPERSMIGPRAVEAIRSYRAELAFLGVPALDCEHGFTADGDAEAATDTAFMSMARRTIVLADHTKLGRVSTTYVAPLSAVDTVVTDCGASPAQVGELRSAGTRVTVAPVDADA